MGAKFLQDIYLYLFYFYLFKILKSFTKMLHTNLVGCRGKAKKDKKYNISKLKMEKYHSAQ